MGGDLQQEGAATRLARVLDPVGMANELARVDSVDECARIALDATGVAIAALLTRLICAGRAQEIAGYGDKATSDLAEKFGCSKKTIERRGAIYRELIKPRLDRGSASFVLDELSWYATSLEASSAERSALDLLEEAERRRAADRRFTAAKWRRELGLVDESDGATKLDRALNALASFEDDEIDEYIASVTPREKLQRIQDAYTRAGRVLKGIRERMKSRRKAR